MLPSCIYLLLFGCFLQSVWNARWAEGTGWCCTWFGNCCPTRRCPQSRIEKQRWRSQSVWRNQRLLFSRQRSGRAQTVGQSALRLHTVCIGIVPTSFRCCILVGAVTTYPAMTFCDSYFRRYWWIVAVLAYCYQQWNGWLNSLCVISLDCIIFKCYDWFNECCYLWASWKLSYILFELKFVFEFD